MGQNIVHHHFRSKTLQISVQPRTRKSIAHSTLCEHQKVAQIETSLGGDFIIIVEITIYVARCPFHKIALDGDIYFLEAITSFVNTINHVPIQCIPQASALAQIVKELLLHFRANEGTSMAIYGIVVHQAYISRSFL